MTENTAAATRKRSIIVTITDDRGTVSWTQAKPRRVRPIAPGPADTAAVAGGWLFGPRELVAAVRRELDTVDAGEQEVRFGVWAQMPTERDSANAVLIAMLLAMPQGTVGAPLWELLDTETVPEGTIR